MTGSDVTTGIVVGEFGVAAVVAVIWTNVAADSIFVGVNELLNFAMVAANEVLFAGVVVSDTVVGGTVVETNALVDKSAFGITVLNSVSIVVAGVWGANGDISVVLFGVGVTYGLIGAVYGKVVVLVVDVVDFVVGVVVVVDVKVLAVKQDGEEGDVNVAVDGK